MFNIKYNKLLEYNKLLLDLLSYIAVNGMDESARSDLKFCVFHCRDDETQQAKLTTLLEELEFRARIRKELAYIKES